MTVELKPNTKPSGCAHISTTPWLWKISKWWLYYDHVLGAGKLGIVDSKWDLIGGYYNNIISVR